MSKILKKDGFNHEKLLVVPQVIIDNAQNERLINCLYLTDIGFFPKAFGHYRERKEGCEHHILLLCVEGKGKVQLNGQSYDVEKNKYILLPKDEPHTYFSSEEEPWSLYWIHFDGTMSADYLQLLGDSLVKDIDPSGLRWFVHWFQEVYRLLQTGYSIQSLRVVSHYMGLLLTGLKGTLLFQEEKEKEKDLVNSCIDYMGDHYQDMVTLEELSTKFHISKSHLIALFRQKTGYSPIDYFIHLKIQGACQLLDTTSWPIQDISREIGYQDPYYFSRAFKKIMGIAPRQYRKLEKG